ncbi:MAG: cation transporter [Oscillospiraceae bacterium]|nr:cation transporter [Oscillospiraceae bacterium]
MKKTYRMENLECANCAAKMEDAISKLEGVSSISVSFISQRLIIDADEKLLPKIMKKAQKIVCKIEPDCEIVL